MPSDYIDFDLSIDSREGNEYEVSARSSVAGEAVPRPRVRLDLRGLETDLQAARQAIRGASTLREAVRTNGSVAATDAARLLGTRLFETIVTGAVADRYRVTLHEADRRQAAGVRIRLRIQAAQAAALPWELMYDPAQRAFLCTSSHTPIVRYVEVGRPPGNLEIDLPLRILAVVATPHDQAGLQKGDERRRVERALEDLENAGRVQLTWLEGATFDALQAALRTNAWHVLHFIGHGGVDLQTGSGFLLLENEHGASDPISADTLRPLLGDHESLRLVVLNSCEGARANPSDVFSSTAATLVAGGVPAVVAMQHPITDAAAITFADAFFRALADECPVDKAVSDARLKVWATYTQSAEWATPVLFMRSSGNVFPPRKPPAPQRRWGTAAAAVALPAFTVAALATAPVDSTQLEGNIMASAVEFRLDSTQKLGEVLPLESLLASNLVAVDPLGTSNTQPARKVRIAKRGAAGTAFPNLRITDSAGRDTIRLDLRAAVSPAGTRVTVYSDGPSAVLIADGAIPSIGVTASGAIELAIDDDSLAMHLLAEPRRLQLHPTTRVGDSGSVRLEFTPERASALPLARGLIIGALAFRKLERQSGGRPPKALPTIQSGDLGIGRSGRVSLRSGRDLQLSGLHGRMSLTLVDTTLSIDFSGSVRNAMLDDGGSARSLMPQRWHQMSMPARAMTIGIMTILGIALGELARRTRLARRWRTT